MACFRPVEEQVFRTRSFSCRLSRRDEQNQNLWVLFCCQADFLPRSRPGRVGMKTLADVHPSTKARWFLRTWTDSWRELASSSPIPTGLKLSRGLKRRAKEFWVRQFLCMRLLLPDFCTGFYSDGWTTPLNSLSRHAWNPSPVGRPWLSRSGSSCCFPPLLLTPAATPPSCRSSLLRQAF